MLPFNILRRTLVPFLSVCAWAPQTLHAQVPLADHAPIEDRVTAEFNLIKQRWGLASRLILSEGDDIVSAPGGDVHVGMRRLRNDAASQAPENFSRLLRFYMAHELWHQWQFEHDGLVMSALGREEARLAECQADVMAGSVMGVPAGVSFDSAIREAVALAALGRPIRERGRHPTSAQRLMAARFGAQRDQYEKLALGMDSSTALSVVAVLPAVLDLRANEPPVTWSARMCRKLVHADAQALESLSVEPEYIRWNTSASEPFVDYSVTYENMSDRQLAVEAGIFVAAISRTDRSDITRQFTVDTHNVSLVLAPYARREVTGRLAWYADAQRMPRLIHRPLEVGALYSARYVSAPTSPTCLNLSPASLPAGAARTLKSALSALSGQSADGFAKVRGEVKSSSARRTEFASLVNVPQAKQTLISESVQFERSVQTYLYRGESAPAAVETFEKYRDLFRKWCGRDASSFSETPINANLLTVRMPGFSRYMDVTLRFGKASGEGGRQRVYLQIVPKRQTADGRRRSGAGSCIAGAGLARGDFEEGVAAAMFALAKDAAAGFEHLKDGDAGSADETSFVAHLLVDFPSGGEVTLRVNRTEAGEVTSQLYEGPSLPRARQSFARFKAALQAICPNMKLTLSDGTGDEYESYEMERFTHGTSLSLTLWKSMGLDPQVTFTMQSVRR